MIIAKVKSFRSWRSSEITTVSLPPTPPTPPPQTESSLRTLWGRLTLSRITTAYFLFSIAHCIVQVSLQAKAFDINARSSTFIWDLAFQAKGFRRAVIPELHDSFLRLCPSVYLEYQAAEAQCVVVWDAIPEHHPAENSTLPETKALGEASTTIQDIPASTSSPTRATTSSSSVATTSSVSTSTVASTSSSISTTGTSAPTSSPSQTVAVEESDDESDDEFDDESDDSDDESIDGEESDDEEDVEDDATVPAVVPRDGSNVLVVASELSENCLLSLSYPGFILDNTKREDIVFIAFQVWVLGMSFVAIINESIPQIIASCATHLMATAWSAFQITHTNRFRANFHRAVINGACAGTSLIPDYWVQRASLEYAILALNIAALFVSIFLSWKMLKLFGWQTFKRLGASLTIHRIYELILAFTIVLQLSLFFMLVTVSLWIESLFNGVASQVAQFPTFYKATAFITVFLLIPWLITGWFAVRREQRRLMFIFLFLALLYLTGWAVMFYSDSFRWTFLNWLFFSIMASLSVALTVTAFILGVICRYNFGKGLPHFLNPDESLSDTDSRHSFDEEKVAFPSRESRFQVRPFSLVFERVRPPVAAAPPIPEMPRNAPAEPTVAPPTFIGSGRTVESGSHQDLPLARPGFRELILRSDTTSTAMTGFTARS